MFLTRVGSAPSSEKMIVGGKDHTASFFYGGRGGTPHAAFTPKIQVRQLKAGDSGDDVSLLQDLLNRLMSAQLQYTKTMDDPTVEQVKWYQKRSGLTDDGIVGPATWGRITANTAIVEVPQQFRPWGDSRGLFHTQSATTKKTTKVATKKSVPTVIWVVGGLTAVAIIGGVAYALTRK